MITFKSLLPSPPRLRFRSNLRSPQIFLACVLAVTCAVVVRAEHTRRWRISTYEEFLKGKANGVAVRSDGRLELAPKFALIADADASYLWSLRTDPKGVLYAAGGTPAKVFRFDTAGKPTTVFDSGDLSAQAIAFDSQGNLYVGTSPDGKVYRVSSSGEKSVFFDPRTKYIWDLAFFSDGTLYVATGDKGQIFAVNSSGKGELFYSSDEAHIRALAFDPNGNLIAGTEPSGRVLRVSHANAKSLRPEKTKDKSQDESPSAAQGFVLYETAKREVTALAIAPDGTIYVSAIGEKQRNAAPAPSAVFVTPQGTTTITNAPATSAQSAGPSVFVPFPPVVSSSIYRINASGAPDELWSSREDVVYSLGLAADGRLLAGTGNNGALLAIDSKGVFAQLAKSGSAQITGISRGKDGKVFVCTANPGKVFSVGPEFEAEGTYESRSFDAQNFSQWGRLEWWSPRTTESRTAASSKKSSAHDTEPRVEFFARSGNTEDPGKEWSSWSGPYPHSGTEMQIPPARFAQWKAVIHGGQPGDGVDWASLAYLPRNVAPVIDGIAIQEPGVRANANNILSAGLPTPVTLKLPPAPNTSGVIITQSGTPPRFEPPPQGIQQKGYATVLWSAHDDNDDELRYAVYYRGENEQDWKLLKDKLEQKFYSWDTTSFPDGAYYLKIVATDAPSNPPATALAAERLSERFEVDNTPPVIEHLQAEFHAADKAIAVKFTAHDATSSVERAQYSLDGGDWILVSPAGNISDSPEEHYEFTIGNPSAEEHTIAVRAYDHFENVGSAKTTVHVSNHR
jgi:outer membrane protein assembly factor BamB